MAWDVGGQGHGRRRPWGRRAVGRERTRLEQATGARPAGPGTTRGRVRGRAAELQVAGRAGYPEPTGRLRHQRVDSQAGRRPSGRWGTFKAAVGAGGKGPSVRKTGDGGEGEGGDRAGAGDGHARSPEAGPRAGRREGSEQWGGVSHADRQGQARAGGPLTELKGQGGGGRQAGALTCGHGGGETWGDPDGAGVTGCTPTACH